MPAQSAPAQSAPTQAISTAQNAASSVISAFTRSDGERIFGVDIRQTDDADRGLTPQTVRDIQRLATLLALFFAAIIVYVAWSNYSDIVEGQQNAALDKVSSQAVDIDARLGNAVAWTDTAMSTSSPQRMVGVAARGAGVAGSAFVDGDGNLIFAIPAEAGEFLAQAASGERSSASVEIKRVVAENGDINPVVVRQTPSGRLITALGTQTLLSQTSGTSALVSPTGLVIDGPRQIALDGALGGFDMDDGQLARLTNSADIRRVEGWKVSGNKVWLASARVPNSDLTVIHAAPRSFPLSTILKSILPLIGLMGGTCGVIIVMMNRVLNHMKRAQTSSEADEIARQRYQAAIEGTGGGIFEIDLTDNMVFMSKSLVEKFNLGTSDRHLPITQFLSLFHDNSRDTFYTQIRRAHMTGTFNCDVQVRHLPIMLSCQAKPIMRSDEGDAIPTRKVIVGVAHDVTEQRGAQTRLRMAETRLFDALRSMSDAFVIWDQLDRLVLWNARFEEFFGFQTGNLQPGMDRTTIDYHAQNAVENIFPLDDAGTSEVHLKDGRWLRYMETQTEDGGRVTIATEVTEIRRREEEVRQNNEVLESQYETLRQTQTRLLDLARNYEREKIRAEEANQSKSEFLANMSHELRTPLNAINGFSDIMQKEMFGPLGDPRYKEYVTDILFSGKHLLSLINDILDMSKIEAGKMTLNIDTVMVGSMIDQVIRMVRGRAEENRLKLIYRPVEMHQIEADPRAVKQILLNLITNAIKFTPEGGVVRVTAEAKQAGIIVRVADSGMGISPEDLERLAQPFEQASNNNSGEGTGLGLALSKSMVEMHGGNFDITSKLGEGTTITFTLPNRPVPVARDQNATKVSEEISKLADTISNALQHGVAGAKDDVEVVRAAGEEDNLPAPDTSHIPQVYIPPAA
jgi:two-component system cell cycle sensor histidine kinase PleC